MKINKLEKGHCEATVPRHKRWDGIYETFHGGMLGTIADTVTCWSILTEIGADAHVATTDFNIRFLRPCHTDVVCKAHVVRIGRTMCLARADLYDTNGKLVAVSQVNYIRLETSSEAVRSLFFQCIDDRKKFIVSASNFFGIVQWFLVFVFETFKRVLVVLKLAQKTPTWSPRKMNIHRTWEE